MLTHSARHFYPFFFLTVLLWLYRAFLCIFNCFCVTFTLAFAFGFIVLVDCLQLFIYPTLRLCRYICIFVSAGRAGDEIVWRFIASICPESSVGGFGEVLRAVHRQWVRLWISQSERALDEHFSYPYVFIIMNGLSFRSFPHLCLIRLYKRCTYLIPKTNIELTRKIFYLLKYILNL